MHEARPVIILKSIFSDAYEKKKKKQALYGANTGFRQVFKYFIFFYTKSLTQQADRTLSLLASAVTLVYRQRSLEYQ